MKKLKTLALVGLFCLAITSCRDEPTAEERAEKLLENAETKKTKDGKVKVESPDGSETKIKYDEDGNVEKIKTDDNS